MRHGFVGPKMKTKDFFTILFSVLYLSGHRRLIHQTPFHWDGLVGELKKTFREGKIQLAFRRQLVRTIIGHADSHLRKFGFGTIGVTGWSMDFLNTEDAWTALDDHLGPYGLSVQDFAQEIEPILEKYGIDISLLPKSSFVSGS